MTSDTPDALLHKLRAAVAGEVRSDHDLTLRQMAVVLEHFWFTRMHSQSWRGSYGTRWG
jgi:hypothetical protein